jgi:hypothetical protein
MASIDFSLHSRLAIQRHLTLKSFVFSIQKVYLVLQSLQSLPISVSNVFLIQLIKVLASCVQIVKSTDFLIANVNLFFQKNNLLSVLFPHFFIECQLLSEFLNAVILRLQFFSELSLILSFPL